MNKVQIKQSGESGSCVVDGIDVTTSVKKVEMSISGNALENEVAIFLLPGHVDLDLEGVVTLIEPEEDARVLRRAVAFIEALDPEVVESVALEAQTWGSPKSLTLGIMQAIGKAFEDAANQLDGAEDVRGSADDRPDQSDEVEPDLG